MKLILDGTPAELRELLGWQQVTPAAPPVWSPATSQAAAASAAPPLPAAAPASAPRPPASQGSVPTIDPTFWRPEAPAYMGMADPASAAPSLLGNENWLPHTGLFGDMPVPSEQGATELPLWAATIEAKAAAWEHFVATMRVWLQGWGQTQEVEVEVEEAERDDEGRLVVLDRRMGTPKMKRVKVMRTVPVDQPDREKLMKELGSGPHPLPFLALAKEAGGLQRLVRRVLDEMRQTDPAMVPAPNIAAGEDWNDLAEQIAGNMAALSHCGFPDLRHALDPSTRWRRSTP